jgi:hypothetical protein
MDSGIVLRFDCRETPTISICGKLASKETFIKDEYANCRYWRKNFSERNIKKFGNIKDTMSPMPPFGTIPDDNYKTCPISMPLTIINGISVISLSYVTPGNHSPTQVPGRWLFKFDQFAWKPISNWWFSWLHFYSTVLFIFSCQVVISPWIPINNESIPLALLALPSMTWCFSMYTLVLKEMDTLFFSII